MRSIAHRILALVPAIWAGLVIGVSFIATAIKFQAPSLDLPTALDVGRVTFGFFSTLEWGLLALVLLAVFLSCRGRTIAALLFLILLTQKFWILPILNHRVELVMALQPLDDSPWHTVYGILELAKAGLLLALSLSFGTSSSEQHKP